MINVTRSMDMMDEWGERAVGGVDGLENDLADLSLEQSVKTGLKSPEEIERLTVDEQLSDIERAVYLLSSGQEIQRISVIQNLPELLQENNSEGMRRVVPKVREVLHLANSELQEAATIAFVKIIEDQIVPANVYAQTFLQTIELNVDNRDPDIADRWLEVLLDVITYLPKDIIKRDILTTAIAKGQLSQNLHSRLASCQILGKIATRFDSFMIKRDILPLVTALCQNVDYEVRACMCRQLDAVARGLGLEPTKSAILPELVDLSNDEESCVRLAALETIVSLLSLLDDDTCTQTIIPLVCKFCENAMQSEDSTLPVVAKQFGKLCHGLSVNLSDDQKSWFLDFYRKLCVIGLNEKSRINDRQSPPVLSLYREEDRYAECRRYSAFNFPCLVLFVGARNFKSDLHGTFTSLCDDPNKSVRITTACGFHEVAKLLGSSIHIIQGELISLLKDESLDVIQGVVSNLPDTLDAFSKGTGSVVTETKILGFGFDNLVINRRVTGLSELIPAFMSAENQASNSMNWRLHADVLDKFSALPRCLTSDQIHNKFVPLVYKQITTHRVLPVQLAAARTLCVFMRYNRKLEQRQEICSKLIEGCCHSKNYRYRKLFIDICLFVMELFSKTFFKENFYNFVLELAQDPVANVRLRFCSILPKLKSQMKLPKDMQNLQQLELEVRKLLSMEKDNDVVTAVRSAVFELDRIQVYVESLTKRHYMEDDLLDQKKEEEERLLLEMERREHDDHSDKAGSSNKNTSSSSKTDKRKTVEGRAIGKESPSSAPSSPSSRKVTTSRINKSAGAPGSAGRRAAAAGTAAATQSSSNTSVQGMPSQSSSSRDNDTTSPPSSPLLPLNLSSPPPSPSPYHYSSSLSSSSSPTSSRSRSSSVSSLSSDSEESVARVTYLLSVVRTLRAREMVKSRITKGGVASLGGSPKTLPGSPKLSSSAAGSSKLSAASRLGVKSSPNSNAEPNNNKPSSRLSTNCSDEIASTPENKVVTPKATPNQPKTSQKESKIASKEPKTSPKDLKTSPRDTTKTSPREPNKNTSPRETTNRAISPKSSLSSLTRGTVASQAKAHSLSSSSRGSLSSSKSSSQSSKTSLSSKHTGASTSTSKTGLSKGKISPSSSSSSKNGAVSSKNGITKTATSTRNGNATRTAGLSSKTQSSSSTRNSSDNVRLSRKGSTDSNASSSSTGSTKKSSSSHLNTDGSRKGSAPSLSSSRTRQTTSSASSSSSTGRIKKGTKS
ncbi:serine/threonine-protein phosphatase 4 regulatory subunit 4-like [Amphiura filiformis]|uniref:serine/threonine-protein phosphatase 4 regulatory subunit 4-like n=1 Tax=Amphiura filiformis TaxID=82378 RepID=UPI003B21F308